MDSSFFIKVITLPSGKKVEIVYHQQTEASTPTPCMDVCPKCMDNKVYPVSWKDLDDDTWDITLRCGNCCWEERGMYDHETVEEFDQVLNQYTDMLIDDLERTARDNFMDDIARFIFALQEDAVLPEDF